MTHNSNEGKKKFMFQAIKRAPDDPILGLSEEFKKDPRQDKVNLSVGIYCNEQGETTVLDVVKKAEQRIWQHEANKVYLPMSGRPEYAQCIRDLLLGDKSIPHERVCVAQTVGATGAMRIAADFAVQQLQCKTIWVSDPTWGNHYQVFQATGLAVKEYSYYDADKRGLAFDALCEDLQKAQAGDLVLLHGCCHNPTGIDLSSEQWETLAALTAKQGLLPLFDFAYQGFGQGVEEDALGLRTFLKHHQYLIIGNSFSKNLGLYSERVGACTVVTQSQDEAERVLSQLKIIVRASYSSPPAHGGKILTTICQDKELYKAWQVELTQMRTRLHEMRALFADRLEDATGRDFAFLRGQIGMFSYTGLSATQVQKLKEDHGIYLLKSGRVNVAGLNKSNIDRVCQAIKTVLSA